MNKIICLSFGFLFLLAYPAYSQSKALKINAPTLESIPQETRELVRRLLDANGTRTNLVGIFSDIIQNAPPEYRDELNKALSADGMIEQLIPIYAKHFSSEELKELLAFYKSPVGAKNLRLTPRIMTEVMQTSTQYLEEKAGKIQKRENQPKR